MSHPSTQYRDNLREGVRLFCTDAQAELFPEGVSNLRMDDLEAAFELVFDLPPQPPAGYQSRRPPHES
jgi:hypothetical protein